MTSPSTVRIALRVSGAFLLAFGLLFPYFIEQVFVLRLLVVAIGFGVLVLEILLLEESLGKRLFRIIAVGGYLGVAVAAIEVLAGALGDRLFAVNAEHLFVMFPLFALLGWTIFRSGQGRLYVVTILGVACLVAILAVAESVVGFSLLGRDYEFAVSQREGSTRALVGAENVLVLGAILATMVPLSLKLGSTRLQFVASIVLVAGAWATGSRAPALVCTIVAAAMLVPFLRSLLQRYLWIVRAGAAAAFAGLAYLSVFVWTPFIAGTTGLDYSANYRGALFSLVPEFLVDRPLGYLLRTPTAGEWVVKSELHGTFDISRSVDSEIVYAIFGLGWLGLVMFLAAVFVSIAAMKHDVSIGVAALSLSVLGISLALHGWDAMSPLWYSLLGVCIGLTARPYIRRRPDAERQPASLSRRWIYHSKKEVL